MGAARSSHPPGSRRPCLFPYAPYTAAPPLESSGVCFARTWFSGRAFMRLNALILSAALTYLDMVAALDGCL